MADVLYYDVDTRVAYRITVRRLTVGDGVAVDSEQDTIATREDVAGRLLLTLRNFPLLRHATVSAERAMLDEAPPADADGTPVFPDDVSWQAFDLTEEAFLSLDEMVSWAWLGAVLDKNPHRNSSYEALKKALSRARQAPNSMGATSARPSSDSIDANNLPAVSSHTSAPNARRRKAKS